MSKDLEREYKAFVNSEVPDLWSRIEAGLEEKTPSDSSAEMMDLRITDFHRKKISLKVWAGFAAACVCVALIIPAMTRMARMGGSTSNSSGQNDASPPINSFDMAEVTCEDNVFTDGADGMAQEAVCEEGITKAAADSGGDISNNTAADNINISSDFSAGADSPAEAAEEEMDSERFAAFVEILDTDIRKDSGVLYTAKVITSEHSGIQAGSEIKIFSAEVSSLENKQTYNLILCEEQTDDSQQEVTYILLDE